MREQLSSPRPGVQERTLPSDPGTSHNAPRFCLSITSLGIKKGESRDGNVSNDVETSSPLPHQRCKIPRGHRHDQVASTADPSKKLAGVGILEVLVLSRQGKKSKGKGG